MHTSEHTIEQLFSLAREKHIPYAEVIVLHHQNHSLSVRLQKPEQKEFANTTGLGLRAIDGKKQVCVSTSDLSSAACEQLTTKAAEMLAFAPEDPHLDITPTSEYATSFPDLDLKDPTPPSNQKLIELALEAEAAALDTPDITNSNGASADFTANDVLVANSRGFLQHYQTTSSSLSVSVVASRNGHMQRDYDMSIARHHHDLIAATTLGKNAAERAVKKLGSRQISTCQVPVIFERRLARQLLAQFAQAINGATVAKGTSFLKNALGTTLFHRDISITNDPLIPKGLASKPFDAEAMPCQPIELVTQGTLNHWLLDRRSAKQLNLSSNGCATRSISGTPYPATANLYMHNGTHSLETLIGDIKQGLYITETFGMGVNITTGDYSQGAAGFWIENGQISYPVENVTIAGHLLEMFKSATCANDLAFDYATNAPSLRIEQMTVAGN